MEAHRELGARDRPGSQARRADFRLDPPAGFAYQAIAKPTIAEDEMVAYLGAAARFNDGDFPDSPYAAFNREKFNLASKKAAADQTPAEQELIKLHDAFLMREVYKSPVLQFVEDHTEPGSFQYVGAGAKVGQADRIVCWFTTRERQSAGPCSVTSPSATSISRNCRST